MASSRVASRLSRATPSLRQSFQTTSRRTFASSSRAATSANSTLLLGAGAAAFASFAGYSLFQKNSVSADARHVGIEADALRTEKEALNDDHPSYIPKEADYQKVYNAIAKRLHEIDDYDDGSYGPVLLRLGWHASGTYDAATGTGGSNGATMRFDPERDHGANSGLAHARDFLEPVKKQFPWITYSDLWTLAAVCSIQEMHGPVIPWRPGRSDRDQSFCTPDGRLPDGSKGNDHLRAIFGRMGFSDREIVALSGAHALGRCHTDRSGFDGPWTHSPTVVTNDYFQLLLQPNEWDFRAWKGPQQYQDKSSKSLMMLPTDMALVKDKVFKEWVEKYAKDNDLFFNDFSAVLCRLFELGVPFESTPDSRLRFKPTL